LAVDIVIALDQADVLHLGADFHHSRRALDLQVLDDRHAVAVLQDVAVSVAHDSLVIGLARCVSRPLVRTLRAHVQGLIQVGVFGTALRTRRQFAHAASLFALASNITARWPPQVPVGPPAASRMDGTFAAPYSELPVSARREPRTGPAHATAKPAGKRRMRWVRYSPASCQRQVMPRATLKLPLTSISQPAMAGPMNCPPAKNSVTKLKAMGK